MLRCRSSDMYTAEQVQSAIWQTIVKLEEQRMQSQHIDNEIMSFAGMTGGKEVMAKERRRIVIGYHDNGQLIHKQVQA